MHLEWCGCLDPFFVTSGSIIIIDNNLLELELTLTCKVVLPFQQWLIHSRLLENHYFSHL